jgi:hypothetical protein
MASWSFEPSSGYSKVNSLEEAAMQQSKWVPYLGMGGMGGMHGGEDHTGHGCEHDPARTSDHPAGRDL